MLEVQKYLRSGKTLEDLKAELAINVVEHDFLPLVLLDYDHIASPKFNSIVQETRGLILEKGTWNAVGVPMRRFYNLGECPDNDRAFDWENFWATEKCDGTFVMLSNYRGHWIVSTRGTFGDREVGETKRTWRDHFLEASGNDLFLCDHLATYIFELWTPSNVVVRYYDAPCVWLLAMTNYRGEELSWPEVQEEAGRLRLNTPSSEKLTLAQVLWRLKEHETNDPTFEGYVLRDHRGIRIKVKTETYRNIHRMIGNGNLFLPKNLVPLWLSGNYGDVLKLIPQARKPLEEVGFTLYKERLKLYLIWRRVKDIEDQKEFALAIKDKTPFSAILFDLRKRYLGRIDEVTFDVFCDAWKRWGDLILKKLFQEKEMEAA